MLLRDAIGALASVIFPAPCRICGEMLANAGRLPICEHCFERLGPYNGPACGKCGRPFASPVALEARNPLCFACRQNIYGFDNAASYAEYNDEMSRAIILLKYEQLTRLGAWFAARLAEKFRREQADLAADVVVPVPLHRARRRERGYNQAELIARPFARKIGLPIGTYLLVRTRPRPPQLLLSRRERWETVRGAYETREGVRVDNLRVLLIDDVFTTGATLDACARVLKKAGAKSVSGLTVARVISRGAAFSGRAPSGVEVQAKPRRSLKTESYAPASN